MHELPVELAHQVGMFEHDLGHVGPGLQVAPALKLEQVALRADHGAVVEARQEIG